MIAAARAALLLGGSSIVSILTTLATAKALAVLVGPHGVGAFGLMQSVVDLAALAAGVGVSVSLVRLVADALDRGDDATAAAVRTASTRLVWSLGGAAGVVIVALHDSIARALFGTSALGLAVLAAGLAVPFSLGAATNVALLSAYRQVGAIAALRSLAAATMACVTIVAVWAIGEPGVAIGIAAAAVVLWLAARQLLPPPSGAGTQPGSERVTAAARQVVRFGLPYAASALVGTGVQLAIPIVVALIVSTDAAGFYRAATQISAGYLTFIAAAMLQDYYPRLSGEQARPDVLVALIDQQLKLVLVLTVPLVLIGIAASDIIVPLLYSDAFLPAVAILSWQLVGTLLKLPSWTLSFAILARGRTDVYFLVELIGGIALLAASVVGLRWLGLAGLGVAVLVTYAVYYPLVWFAVRRDVPLRVTRAQLVLLGTTAAALVSQLMPALGLADLRQPVAVALAAGGCAGAVLAVAGMARGRGGTDPEQPGVAAGSPPVPALDRDRTR